MNETADISSQRQHYRHLEQARSQVIELLSRQAVERELLQRQASENHRQDVVAQLVARQHQAALETRLASFHPADIAFVLESLDADARDLAWGLVKPERRGAVLLETSDAVRRMLVATMAPDDIAAVVTPLDSDDIADLVSSLPDEIGQQVLQHLDNADQVEVRSMLSFPEDSVGAAMDLDFVTVREDASLEAVLRLLRRRKTLPLHTNQIFVVDRGNRLRGSLSLSQLVLADPEAEVGAEMTRDPTYFYTDDPMREAVTAFEKYDLLSAPVVNLHNQVVGRMTVETVVDAIKEQAATDSLRQVGLSEHEDLFGPVKPSARNRWPWIGLNLITSFASSRVIGMFDDVIAQFAAVATLIPIVASLGGNTGTQTMELVIRALALDQLGPAQLRRTFIKEMLVALLNGSMWGAALGGMTYLLYGKFTLALVIYAAMVIELVVGAFAGVAIPVTLKRIGRDPVMGSSVILTAITDSMGFFMFLGLATLFLV
jgi:magnesium transporter